MDNISTFKISDSNSIEWRSALRWWMAPKTAKKHPSEAAITSWYKFAAENFIYKLNWALGSILGVVLNESEEITISSQWKDCELPWAVLWYKDMISWGTLDPIAAYILSQKIVFTRTEAEKVAVDYWDSISDSDDSGFDPAKVKKWLRKGQGTTARKDNLRLTLNVELSADFSHYREHGLYVLPIHNDNKFGWLDAAGYLMAESTIPEKWDRAVEGTFDYFLDISNSVVKITRYI